MSQIYTKYCQPIMVQSQLILLLQTLTGTPVNWATDNYAMHTHNHQFKTSVYNSIIASLIMGSDEICMIDILLSSVIEKNTTGVKLWQQDMFTCLITLP